MIAFPESTLSLDNPCAHGNQRTERRPMRQAVACCNGFLETPVISFSDILCKVTNHAYFTCTADDRFGICLRPV